MANQKAVKRREVGDNGPVRYAVVGLGYFAQEAVLPAFAHAKRCKLAALVSDDPVKLRKLSRKYGVENTYNYGEFQDCLDSGEIDAVYIALPNDMHKEYAVRAAKSGVHVLCEKPMAVTARDCEEMIREAGEHDVRLMIAYRLHLDEANLQAIETVKSGKIGEPRIFSSDFCMQVQEDNIRTKQERGGGSLYDLGVYCINAARYLFQSEPYEVTAFSAAKQGDARFKEVDEMTSAVLRFPGDRLATFTASFGAADVASYRVIGTKGDLLLEPAYEYAMPMKMKVTVGGKTKKKRFPKRDQVAAELEYFAECVRNGQDPEPDGKEGLADVRIVQALYESALSGKPVKLEPVDKPLRPHPGQAKSKPPVDRQKLIHAQPASK